MAAQGRATQAGHAQSVFLTGTTSPAHARQAAKAKFHSKRLSVRPELLYTDDELKRRLKKCRLSGQNQYCADCEASDATWASVTFRIFICHKCAGVHRSLGTAVSTVKSINLDKWTIDLVEGMEQGGNAASNAQYEKFLATNGGLSKPTAGSPYGLREQFITAKYVDKAFTVKKKVASNTGAHTNLLAEAMPIRLVDYFLVMGRGQPTARRRGHTLKDSLLDVVYEPTLVEQYPREDHKDAPCSPNVPMFAFPADIVLEEKEVRPQLLPFVLTKVNGAKQYGVCLKFYEKMDALELVALHAHIKEMEQASKSASSGKRRKPSIAPRRGSISIGTEVANKWKNTLPNHIYAKDIWSPKAICILSHWPFLKPFSSFVCMLYRIFLSNPPLPLERFISNFVNEVPVPPPGRLKVLYTIADQVVPLTRTPPNQFPLHHDLGLYAVFEHLSPDHIFGVVLAIATEQKVVFASSSWATLVHVCEGFCSLIYPFFWQGVYMPVLPSKLFDYLYAPVPFIAGVHSSFVAEQGQPPDVVFVDIDKDEVSVPSIDTLPAVPDKDRNKLFKRLKQFADVHTKNSPSLTLRDLAFPHGEDLHSITTFATTGGIQIQEESSKKTKTRLPYSKEDKFDQRQVCDSFLRFWVKILMKYRSFLNPPDKTSRRRDGRPEELFDKAGFLEASPQEYHPLLKALMDTQQFSFFINERWSPTGKPSPDDIPEVRFFDECILSKQNRSASSLVAGKAHTPFLNDTSYKITNTFFAPPPDTSGLAAALYQYEYFPDLKDELFGPVRYVKPLIEENTFQRTQMSSMLQKASNVLMVSTHRARTDWSGTLRAVIAIQRVFRGHRARKRFRALKRAVGVLQGWVRGAQGKALFLRRRGAAQVLQAVLWAASMQRHVRAQREAAVVLQAALRVPLVRVHRQRIAHMARSSAAATLQAVMRCALVRNANRRRLNAIRTLQACMAPVLVANRNKELKQALLWVSARLRVKHERDLFRRKVEAVIKVQSVLRGTLVRQVQKRSMLRRRARLRQDIVRLWHDLKVPLLYRSMFWMIFYDVSFINLAFHDEELERLKHAKNNRTEKQLRSAADKLAREATVIYTTLKHNTPDAVKESLFRTIGIDSKGKKRKQAFLQALWAPAGSPTRLEFKESDADAEPFAYEHRSAQMVLTVMSSAHTDDERDVSSVLQARREQRVRSNLLFTVRSGLESLRKQRQRHVRMQDDLASARFATQALRKQLAEHLQHAHQRRQRSSRFTSVLSSSSASAASWRPHSQPAPPLRSVQSADVVRFPPAPHSSAGDPSSARPALGTRSLTTTPRHGGGAPPVASFTSTSTHAGPLTAALGVPSPSLQPIDTVPPPLPPL